MVSCSGFGLPLHAQLLRLFVTKDTLQVEATESAPGYLQRFMPPEQLQGMPRSADGDVWAETPPSL